MIDQATIEEFIVSLRGQLIQPSDEDYKEACKIYNAMIDRRPGMIVRCADVADVMAAVNFARENNTLVAIRGGRPQRPWLGNLRRWLGYRPVTHQVHSSRSTSAYSTGWRGLHMGRCGSCNPCLRFGHTQWGRLNDRGWRTDPRRWAWVPDTQVRSYDRQSAGGRHGASQWQLRDRQCGRKRRPLLGYTRWRR